jgi:acyl carrier protein
LWTLVDLGEAARRIEAHPEIRQIAAVRSPSGQLYVLVEQQGFVYGTVLRDIVLDEVELPEPNVAVAVVRSIPRTETDGSVDPAASVALAQQVVEDRRWVFTIEPAETPEEKAIAEMLLDLLNAKRVSMTDSLPLLGVDSLVLVELSAAITGRFGVTVNAMDLFDADSVREVAQLVAMPKES